MLIYDSLGLMAYNVIPIVIDLAFIHTLLMLSV